MTKPGLVALLAALGLACRGGRGELPLIAYHPEGSVSVRYPVGWRMETEQREGASYRHFLAPPAGADRRPAASVTLISAELGGSLDEYAQLYLKDKGQAESREVERQGAKGRSYRYASTDGAQRFSLLQDGPRVLGLFGQAAAAPFAAHAATIEAMEKSLTLERPELYPEHRNAEHAFSLRVPPSWQLSRSFAGGAGSLTQFSSPALLADRNGQTAHASLTVTTEAASGGLEAFYRSTRERLGEAYKVFAHEPWGSDGFVDFMKVETPVAESRIKRFYRVAGGRGYTLSCDARDDAYPLVGRWCEVIASTFRAGGVGAP
jgi:hypothetical protein